MGEAFEQHERRDFINETFSAKIYGKFGIALNFDQFTAGWLAVFVGPQPEMVEGAVFFDDSVDNIVAAP